jgi:crotonobetainyl-CoA:carnitine CoA-transferase CaiB-like acyl-CoA transferase
MSGACPCYGTYRAADERWLAVGALEVAFWRAFCAAIDRPDLLTRQFDRSAVAEVAAVIATRPSLDWLEIFPDDACVELVRYPAEARSDPNLSARGLGAAPVTPAPQLGQDTDDVLAQAGIAPAVVGNLSRSGVITGPRSAARSARAARLGAMLARRSHSPVQRSA